MNDPLISESANSESANSEPARSEPASNQRPDRLPIILAGMFGAIGVAIGAYGAHGLETTLAATIEDAGKLAKRVDQFNVGVRYHLVHAVAMLAISSAAISVAARRRIAIGFAFGTVFFSGSLYLLVLLEIPILGAVTPIGGVAWIVSWTMLVVAAWRT